LIFSQINKKINSFSRVTRAHEYMNKQQKVKT
jgi:hypothetical protein